MKMADLRNLSRPLVLDGATGTQLQKRGMPSGCCSEAWILEHPETILDLQGKYVRAGSDIVYAPTFGANRASLKAHGCADRVREMNLRLVELSRQAVEGRALVGGDLSSTGLMLPPMGDTSFEELVDIFAEQVSALAEAGVDFFAVETQTSLAEARAIVTAVRAVSEKPILCSFPMGPTGRTLHGGDLRGILVSMEAMGVDAFGVNCTGDLDLLSRILADMAPLSGLPLIAKPNAGMPRVEGGRTVYDLPASDMERAARRFAAAGAGFLGGCCGTGEEHIAAIRAVAESVPYTARKAEETWYACEFAAVPESAAKNAVEVAADEDFEDNARDAIDDGAPMIRVEIPHEDALDEVLDAQHALKAPLWAAIPEGELRARFLREYNGKAKLD